MKFYDLIPIFTCFSKTICSRSEISEQEKTNRNKAKIIGIQLYSAAAVNRRDCVQLNMANFNLLLTKTTPTSHYLVPGSELSYWNKLFKYENFKFIARAFRVRWNICTSFSQLFLHLRQWQYYGKLLGFFRIADPIS